MAVFGWLGREQDRDKCGQKRDWVCVVCVCLFLCLPNAIYLNEASTFLKCARWRRIITIRLWQLCQPTGARTNILNRITFPYRCTRSGLCLRRARIIRWTSAYRTNANYCFRHDLRCVAERWDLDCVCLYVVIRACKCVCMVYEDSVRFDFTYYIGYSYRCGL